MTISVNGVNALTTKGIDGMVRDAIYKNSAYLARLKAKQGSWSGSTMTFPFNYLDDTGANGGYYQGSEALSLDQFDPITELSFDLKELHATLVITHRDLALNQGRPARLKLVEERLKLLEQTMRQLLTKGVMSDGTVSTGALSAQQLIGMQAFLKSSSVNYGGITDTDISQHVSYVASNSGTNRAVTTALIQEVIGGASEGNIIPQLAVCRQGVLNNVIELLKPHQRTTRDNNLDNLGHAGNTLVYSGVDFIVDNLAEANAISFLNEDYVKLYAHPEYDMKQVAIDDLETQDAMMKRLFWKGAYIASVLRYNGKLDDVTG